MISFTLARAGMGLLGLCAMSAAAATMTVNTADRGYYYSYDFHDSTNKNYLTGQLNVSGVIGFHSFFAFDPLSGLSGPIVSATLNLFNPAGGYSSPQLSEMLTIDGFSGNIATLKTSGTNAGEYAALGSGTVYGTKSVSAADNNAFVAIPLNPAAIAFLNANGGGAFAFGGYLAGIPPSDMSTRFVFGGSNFMVSNDNNTTLTLVTAPAAVPEPSTWLVVLPLMGLLAVRKTAYYRARL